MRFSIRDLLWVTLVVAMGLGWWADNQTKHAAVHQAHKLHSNLDLAKKWFDLTLAGHFHPHGRTTPASAEPSAAPDWTALDEPLVEP
jgi:hypothetical protein